MKKLLINITPAIRALDLTTKATLGGELIGGYKSKYRGRGIEFEEFGDYAPGEDASQIDWKASVRANKLLIREYTEERDLRIFFLIDVSNSMIYTTGRKLKAEYAGEVIVSLAFIMVKNADRIGYALFNDKITEKSTPQGGLVQYYKLIDTLLNSENYGGGYNLNNALEFAFTILKPNSIIIIISDFIGLDTKWQELLKINAKRFDIIAIMIRDPADLTIPKSKRSVTLRDPYSNKRIRIYGGNIREDYEKYVRQHEKDMSEFFSRLGVSFLRLDTSKPFVEPVRSFFHRRRARWR